MYSFVRGLAASRRGGVAGALPCLRLERQPRVDHSDECDESDDCDECVCELYNSVKRTM